MRGSDDDGRAHASMAARKMSPSLWRKVDGDISTFNYPDEDGKNDPR